MSAIIFDNVNVTYSANGKTALNEFDLTVNEGEIVSVIGPSGCGKSTALNVAAGLLPPNKGVIYVNGVEVKEPGLDRGVVFQNYSLFPWMSVLENITFSLSQADKLSKGELITKAADILAKVGLDESTFHVFPSQLSGGMQQRAAIARTFALDAPVFLMDEPFSALDEITRSQLHELLLNLWEAGATRKTIFIVTHHIDEAIFLSDRVVVLNDGRTVLEKEIPFARPRSRKEIETDRRYQAIRFELLDAVSGIRKEVWQ